MSARPNENADSQKKDYITSFSIFSKYIVPAPDADSEVDVSGVFSRECFLQWLETRTRKIKHPANSYQRVLYAHIRGADKRKPFPEDVEKKLLKLLRDRRNNPWANVFAEEQIEFGKRGFNRRGFHELSGDEQEALKTKMPKKRNLGSSSGDEAQAVVFEPVEYGNLPSSVIQHQHKKISLTVQDISRHLPLIPQSPWEIVWGNVQAYVPLEQRVSSLATMTSRNLKFWSPALQFYLDQVIDPDDYRFSWMFLFPSADEQVFREDRPVGKISYNLGNQIVFQDEVAAEMFKGSLLGKHMFEMYASFSSLCYSFVRSIPALFGKGRSWQRLVFRRCDGTQFVCLMFAELNEAGNGYTVHLQDQSEFFPSVNSQLSLV